MDSRPRPHKASRPVWCKQATHGALITETASSNLVTGTLETSYFLGPFRGTFL